VVKYASVREVNEETRHILAVYDIGIVEQWEIAEGEGPYFPVEQAYVSVLVENSCSLERTKVVRERRAESKMILEMRMTNCDYKGHCYISVVSGQEMELAYPCLHPLHDECEAVVAADVAYVDDSAGKEVVRGEYPFCWLQLADEKDYLAGLEM